MNQPVLPSGEVTFVFTDIEDSTGLWQRHPETMKDALARHHRILHDAITDNRGHVFQVVGDAFCTVFADAGGAVTAALAAQRALHAAPWGEVGSLRVRMGIHTGPAEAGERDYESSLTLIRAQRVMTAGHGGQTLLSAAAAAGVQARLPTGVTLRDLGAFRLRGLAAPERLFQLIGPDLPSDFPAPRAFATDGLPPDAVAPLDALVQGGLVGRDRELDQLRQRWMSAQEGHGQLVLIAGEPGVGKTRLARALMSRVQDGGTAVLQGACYEQEAATPYLPLVEAFRDWVHLQPEAVLRARLGATASEIARLAPEIEAALGPLAPNPPLPPNEERLRLFDSVARFLQTLATPHGLLLFIDDLHWADQGTLSLLHYVLRRLRRERLLLIATYREVELDRTHPLAAALVDWNRDRLAIRLSLGRLSEDETGVLLATLFGQPAVPVALTTVVYRETEGNPFFVEEVVKSLVEQGQIYRDGERWTSPEIQQLSIPQSIKEAIGRRLSRLSPACIDLLHTAAVIGKLFSFRQLVTVVGLGGSLPAAEEDRLLDALDEATRAQLLRAEGSEGFAFTHDKIREVLYAELNPIRRRRLHQRVGEALEHLYAADPEPHASDLAHHFGQSGHLEGVLTHALRAAERAERLFAHEEALRHYGQAGEAAEALDRPASVALIHQRRGDVHRLRGDTALAVLCYERALTGVTDREQRGVLQARIGEVYAHVGDPRGLPCLEAALAGLDPEGQRREVALATALVGRYYHYRAEHRRALEWLERARVLAEPIDDASTLCTIYTFLAGGHQHTLRFADSDRWARASVALGERKGFPLAIAYGHEFLSENAFARGHWDEALDEAGQNHALAERIGAQNRMAWASYARATALWGKGDLREAHTTIRAALDRCERIGEARLATWLEPLLAMVEVDLGDDEAARRHGERGRARGEALGQVALYCWSLHGVGYCHVQFREWEAAAAVYRRGLERLADSENLIARHYIGATAGEAFLMTGDVEMAGRLVDEQLALARQAEAPHYEALARRVQGQVLAARAAWSDAERAFSDAIATFERLGSRLELGRALAHRASLSLREERIDTARLDLHRARDVFAVIGASRDRARVEAALVG